jgi:YjbE family integral membrane protein
MDLGSLVGAWLDLDFISRLFSIIIIDLILAGDNAVVIAMAVRQLPREQRKKGIILGAGAAVVLRVLLTFFVSQLLQISLVKLIGGALILWVAVKLFVEGVPEEGIQKESATIGQAIRTIVIADISMSLDNMLAVGGASGGSIFLLIFGLGLSIPFIVFTSNLLSSLMDRYPMIIYAGAAILGKVSGEMIMTDPLVINALGPSNFMQYAVEAFLAVGVIVGGKLWIRWRHRAERSNDQESSEAVPREKMDE